MRLGLGLGLEVVGAAVSVVPVVRRSINHRWRSIRFCLLTFGSAPHGVHRTGRQANETKKATLTPVVPRRSCSRMHAPDHEPCERVDAHTGVEVVVHAPPLELVVKVLLIMHANPIAKQEEAAHKRESGVNCGYV